ncbi:transcriptional regulator swi6 [Nowakowskiella sp. JEL0078]|nr:transcriptional regulator swi6 [Nowakowskiella sp. JEL0078]
MQSSPLRLFPQSPLSCTPTLESPLPGQLQLPATTNLQTRGHVYSAVYSGIAVYELMCKNISVMRRRSDSFLNATQILKIAGIDKGRRTKILERDVVSNGEHEKVQGGYGKYQGTWVPFERGLSLAIEYEVDGLIRPLLDIEIPNPRIVNQIFELEKSSPKPKKRRTKIEETQPNYETIVRTIVTPDAPTQESPMERDKTLLMGLFMNPNIIPDFLTGPDSCSIDLDMVIDDLGHASIHWAAALARTNVLRIILERRGNPGLINHEGETALIRAVIVTNGFDCQNFPETVKMLHLTIPHADKRDRTVLHHIAITGTKARAQSAKYYMECILDCIAMHHWDFHEVVNKQDKNGDTALNIACKVGNRGLINLLLDVGASTQIENRMSVKPADYGFKNLVR